MKNIILLKIFNSEFPYMEVWFNDQNSNSIEMEDKIKYNILEWLNIY